MAAPDHMPQGAGDPLAAIPTNDLLLAVPHLDEAGRYMGRPGLPIIRELDNRCPRDIGVHLHLARCLAASGQRKQAIDILLKALRLRTAKSALYPADDPATLQKWIRDELERLTEPERKQRAKVREELEARRRALERRRRERQEARRQAEEQQKREKDAANRAREEAETRRVIVAEAKAALIEASHGRGSLRAIYHATHGSNLRSILNSGAVLCFRRAQTVTDIGDADIKAARQSLLVPPARGKVVADFVPFYFTPLTPMMYRVACELGERGGESSLVILVAQAERILSAGLSCYVTSRNAVTRPPYEPASVHTLASVPNWEAIEAPSWDGNEQIRRDRQAEFLVADQVPLDLLDSVAVSDRDAQRRVQESLRAATIDLPVEVRARWFF